MKDEIIHVIEAMTDREECRHGIDYAAWCEACYQTVLTAQHRMGIRHESHCKVCAGDARFRTFTSRAKGMTYDAVRYLRAFYRCP